MTATISGILLAAGKSTRYGGHKLLHSLPDTSIPVALQAARNLLQVLPHSVAVVREHDLALKNLLSPSGIRICENTYADQGISSSIKTGILALDKLTAPANKCQGYVIALADMPFINPAVIQKVVEGLTGECLICAPHYKGQRGHPVGFSSRLKDELLALRGENGARSIITKYQEMLRIIDADTNGILTDIDYPEDLFHQSDQ